MIKYLQGITVFCSILFDRLCSCWKRNDCATVKGQEKERRKVERLTDIGDSKSRSDGYSLKLYIKIETAFNSLIGRRRVKKLFNNQEK